MPRAPRHSVAPFHGLRIVLLREELLQIDRFDVSQTHVITHADGVFHQPLTLAGLMASESPSPC
ncbi:hypothetical protein SCALM49S_00992 [Streptomyces californicus]